MGPKPPDSRERVEPKPAEDPQTARLREKYSGRAAPSPIWLASAGLELAGVIVALTFGGWWLDTMFDSQPWLMITGVAVGAIGGIYSLWRRGKQFFRK